MGEGDGEILVGKARRLLALSASVSFSLVGKMATEWDLGYSLDLLLPNFFLF